MIQVPRFKNNGQITKFLLKIANSNASEEEIGQAATAAMMKFPLSSHKLLYDDTLSKMPAALQPVLLGAAVNTDNLKAQRSINYLTGMGMSKKEAVEMTLPFGRSTIKAKELK